MVSRHSARRGSSRRVVASVIAAMCALTAAAQGLSLVAADAATPSGWVVYTRDPGSAAESGDEELYAVRADGTGTTRLTTNTNCADLTPNASRNGAWLAWVQKCGNQVHVMVASVSYTSNGLPQLGTVTNVTKPLGKYNAERWPQFSPDGSKLAFMMRVGSVNYDIYWANFVETNGVPSVTGATRVSHVGTNDDEDCCVSWSPDGTQMVFAANANKSTASFDLYRLSWPSADLAGTPTQTRLTQGAEYEGTPAFDSDGTVVYRCNCPNGDVYRLNPSTGVRTRLTTWGGLDRTPEGFPGGILYARANNGVDEIYSAAYNGASPVNLTNSSAYDLDPTWLPLP